MIALVRRKWLWEINGYQITIKTMGYIKRKHYDKWRKYKNTTSII